MIWLGAVNPHAASSNFITFRHDKNPRTVPGHRAKQKIDVRCRNDWASPSKVWVTFFVTSTSNWNALRVPFSSGGSCAPCRRVPHCVRAVLQRK